MDNMEIWSKVKRVPPESLKAIQAGRLKGKSDINPQWRYQIMTEVFGPIGTGWKFTIDKLWTESAPAGQVFVFAQVSVYIAINDGGGWSDAIPGVGGSMLVAQESSGLHANDEGYKMAVTDALGTAVKMLGVAADVYAGKWDGSKYKDEATTPPTTTRATATPPPVQPPQSQPGVKLELHDGLDLDGMKLQISNWISEMFGPDEASEQLEKMTAWTNSEGKAFHGKKSVWDLGVKPNGKGQTATSVLYVKVRKLYNDWSKEA